MTEPRKGSRQHHDVVLGPGEDLESKADIWPGDTVKLRFDDDSGVDFFLRKCGDDGYEFL
jgi:hypothetical protein